MSEQLGPVTDCGDGPRLVLRPFSEIEPVKVEWLWPRRVPMGKLTLLTGAPGLGKSLVSVDMAARVSTGRPFFDSADTPNPIGRSILVTCEDGADDTVSPRLLAAGADPSRVLHLEGVRYDPERTVPFSLEGDLRRLEDEIRGLGDVRLVVIDPVTGFLNPARDTHKDNQVRPALQALAAMAERARVAVVAICHHKKAGTANPLDRIMGSVAFGAVARSVLMVQQSPAEHDTRYLVSGKASVSREAEGLAFRIENVAVGPAEVGRVQWLASDPNLTAAAAFPDDSDGGRGGRGAKTRNAARWLYDELRPGPALVSDLRAAAAAAGHAWGTVLRAQRELRVESTNSGPGKPWSWSLPAVAQ